MSFWRKKLLRLQNLLIFIINMYLVVMKLILLHNGLLKQRIALLFSSYSYLFLN